MKYGSSHATIDSDVRQAFIAAETARRLTERESSRTGSACKKSATSGRANQEEQVRIAASTCSVWLKASWSCDKDVTAADAETSDIYELFNEISAICTAALPPLKGMSLRLPGF
jgi:hypothetical protein